MLPSYTAFICLDLGDTIMVEESEVKDSNGVTLSADLVPGMRELLWDWYTGRVFLGLVADTMVGTYRHVLYQHGLWDLFRIFAISDELGTRKPDRRMFDHARTAGARLGAPGDTVLMIGNNYARDIAGGKQAGFDTCWLNWNERYPGDPNPVMADGVVRTTDELADWVGRWLARRSSPRRENR